MEPPSCCPTRLRPDVPVLFRSPSRHPRGQDFNVSLAGTQSAHHGGRSERPTLACWLAHLRDARPVTGPPPPLLLPQLLRLPGQAGVGLCRDALAAAGHPCHRRQREREPGSKRTRGDGLQSILGASGSRLQVPAHLCSPSLPVRPRHLPCSPLPTSSLFALFFPTPQSLRGLNKKPQTQQKSMGCYGLHPIQTLRSRIP